MIYLFNSGYRPLYAVDILNALALPTGATITYRYGVGGDHPYVQPAVIDGLPKGFFKRLLARKLRPIEVLLLFVDRDKGYTYHPLRRGTVFETWERDHRRYFRVKLGEFTASNPKRVDQVSESIKFALNKVGPTPPSDPQQPTRDGYYAVLGPDTIGGKPDILTGEDAWKAAVDNLSKTEKFTSTEARSVVFLRTAIQQRGGRSDERPGFSGVLERLPIRKDTAYDLRVSYSSAVVKPEVAAAEVVVEHGESLQLLSAAPLLVQATADDLVVPVITKRYAEDRYSYIRVATRPVSGVTNPDNRVATRPVGGVTNPEVLGPNVNVLIALRETRRFWVTVICLLMAFALATLIVGMSPAELPPATTLREVGQVLMDKVTLWRIGASVAQAFVLFMLLRLIGKKPV
jgi:hypothetical protein